MNPKKIVIETLEEVLEIINKKYFEVSAADFLSAEDVGGRRVCCELEKEVKEKIKHELGARKN